MDINDNDNDLITGRQLQSRVINWIFLPVPMAIGVIGLGILLGLFFNENQFLQGPMKLIIGFALAAYGLIRSGMIIRKLRGRGKDRWIEKS